MTTRKTSIRLGRRSATLIPLKEGTQVLSLNRPLTLIGSREDTDIRLTADDIDRDHVAIINSDGRVYIRDLASRSGLFVNGQRVRDSVLEKDDRLRIGSVEFQFNAGLVLPMTTNGPPALELQTPDRSVRTALDSPLFLIGRRAGADLVLTDTDVDDVHAIIFCVAGIWALRDLGSKSGTHANGRQIRQVQLIPGVKLRMGSLFLRCEFPSNAHASTKPNIENNSPSLSDAGVKDSEPVQTAKSSLVARAIEPSSDLKSPAWLKRLPLAMAAATSGEEEYDVIRETPRSISRSMWGLFGIALVILILTIAAVVWYVRGTLHALDPFLGEALQLSRLEESGQGLQP